MFNIRNYLVSIALSLALFANFQFAFAMDCNSLGSKDWPVPFDITANGAEATGRLWTTGSNGAKITIGGYLEFSPGVTEDIIGECEGRRLSFTRSKPGTWIQKYTGMLKSTGSLMTVIVSQGHFPTSNTYLMESLSLFLKTITRGAVHSRTLNRVFPIS